LNQHGQHHLLCWDAGALHAPDWQEKVVLPLTGEAVAQIVAHYLIMSDQSGC